MTRDKVQAHYNEIAEVYDQRYDLHQGRLYHHHLSSIILERLPGRGLLLDLGCGTGLFIDRYQQEGGRAVGLDISGGMVGMGRLRCPGSEFLIGTADVLPFADESFENIASLLAFTYLRDPEAMLRESYRILQPGGRIAICTLSRNLMTRALPFFYRLGERIGYQKIGVGDFGENYYTEEELMEMFLHAGYLDVESSRCSFAHYTLPLRLFSIAQRCEAFIEEDIPGLAFNICVSGRKEGRMSD